MLDIDTINTQYLVFGLYKGIIISVGTSLVVIYAYEDITCDNNHELRIS